MTEAGLLFGIPLLVAAASVPLIRGWIPPNRIYGFRTGETLASPEIWYPANRALGWALLAAAVLGLAFAVALRAVFAEWSPERMLAWTKVGYAGSILLGVLAAIRYSIKRL